MLALLVLHLCKVSCLCRCIVQRLCSADISVLAYNFWQATKASLLWGEAPVQVVSHLWRCICALTAICAIASCNGFVWLTASILAWSRCGSPSNIAPARMPGVYAQRFCTMQSQPSIHSLSRGKGGWGFGKDAEIERPKALQDAKPKKRSYRDREISLFFKKTDFFYKLRCRFCGTF